MTWTFERKLFSIWVFDNVTWRRLAQVKKFAMSKGIDGEPRWMRGFDMSKRNIRFRHTRMMLSDLALILQNTSPYGHLVDPNDTLDDVFAKCGQSLAACSYILRCHRMFQVLTWSCLLRWLEVVFLLVWQLIFCRCEFSVYLYNAIRVSIEGLRVYPAIFLPLRRFCSCESGICVIWRSHFSAIMTHCNVFL